MYSIPINQTPGGQQARQKGATLVGVLAENRALRAENERLHAMLGIARDVVIQSERLREEAWCALAEAGAENRRLAQSVASLRRQYAEICDQHELAQVLASHEDADGEPVKVRIAE